MFVFLQIIGSEQNCLFEAILFQCKVPEGYSAGDLRRQMVMAAASSPDIFMEVR